MSEMLANRYFIARRFDLALPIFEKEVARGNHHVAIQKKMIICYCAVGRLEEAFELFFELVQQDPGIIINTDPYWDDCPCPQMVKEWENTEQKAGINPREALMIGMLYLYCDLDKAIYYLEKALDYDDYFLKISSVLRHLKKVKSDAIKSKIKAED